MPTTYLIPPEKYKKPNPRIDGFRKLRKVGARTVEILVFASEAFNEFKKANELPAKFIDELQKSGAKIIANAKTNRAVVRRAYVIPGLENPPGPRFLGLETVDEIIDAVKQVFLFAISQGYDRIAENQISGFLYEFIDPPMIDKKNLQRAFLPYGGTAIFINDYGKTIEIYAVYGNNEGAQSLVADRYTIHVQNDRRYFIEKKEIPQKTHMFCTTGDSRSDLLTVPAERQFEQILSDNEIVEIARVAFELSKQYGAQRVEFSADEEGLVFNEVADYWHEKLPERSPDSSFEAEGEIIIVSSLADLDRLALVNEKDLASGKKIVLIDKSIVAKRSYDMLGSLSSWKIPLVVLYPGIAATQHAMRVLVDKGHRAFLVGIQKFKEGDLVKITTTGTKARVINLTNIADERIVSLWDAALLGVELCGGKAYRLSQLKIAGYQVPHGRVITTKMFKEALALLGYSGEFTSCTNFSAMYEAFDEAIFNENHPIRRELLKLLSDYIASGKTYIDRSTSPLEDTAKLSMAGRFKSIPGVAGLEIIDGVLDVMQSTFAEKVLSYLKENPELLLELKMAVAIQEMVDARCVGVIFGADIQTRDFNTVVIEAAKKSGEIVDGVAKKNGTLQIFKIR